MLRLSASPVQSAALEVDVRRFHTLTVSRMKPAFSSVIETVTGSKYPLEQNEIDETTNCIFDLTRTPFRSK
jgi:hypothetical protein